MVNRAIDSPEPGYFRMRLVRHGPFVACRIWRCCSCTVNGGDENEQHDWRATCDRFPPLTATVNGEDQPGMVRRVWTYGRAVDAATYRLMVDRANWDKQYAPAAPAANPDKPLDINTIPPLF